MFNFTKKEYEYIVEEAMLNEEYQQLLKMKIQEYTIPKMAMKLGVSEATISVMVNKLKKKIKKIL